MSDVLNVQKREQTGTLRMRRMRASGMTPAVLYGHGAETIALQIPTKEINSAIRHGNLIVDLKGDLNESALIKDVQWDTFGTDVLHLDLARVDAKEAVDVEIPIELVGDAPGTKAGGIVSLLVHELQINCPANVMPDNLEVKINDLELDQSITAGDVSLPEGASLNVDAETVIVQCNAPVAQAEATEEGGEMLEPEVIGKKDDDESSDD